MEAIQKHWLDILALVSGFIGIVFGFIEKHKDQIQAIVLRIEKEAQDGWTAEEKENLAVDLFFREIYDKLPAKFWYLKLIPKSWIESFIRSTIKDLCKKSHELKDKTVVK